MTRRAPIVIVGGGAAGTLAAIHVAERVRALGPASAREVVVIEPAERLGEGVAYCTTSPSHLLNVRAGGMSAFPDRPGHFTDRARAAGLMLDGTEFLPRMLYARYLRETLADADTGRPSVRHLRARATAVRPEGDALRLIISDGPDLLASDVVIATGNALAPLPWLPVSPRAIRDPWVPGALDGIARDARVAIVGSGLSAVDVMLSLRDRDHGGLVTMISSHGLLPEPHLMRVLPRRPPAIGSQTPARARELVRALRDDALTADDWRQTVDGVRPVTVPTWRSLTMTERRRALRHAFRRWEVRRHRMAPQVAAVVDEQRATGRLTVLRGRVRAVDVAGDQLVMRVDSAGSHQPLPVDVVIACVGPSADPFHDPLLLGAIEAGLVVRHPLGLGLDVDDAGRARRPGGTVYPHLWTVGSLRKGAEWESTAVPELRLHAHDIAAALIPEG